MARFRCPTTTESSSSIESIDPTTRRVDATGRLSKVAKMTLRPDSAPSSNRAVTRSKRKRSTTDDQKKAMIKEAHRLDKLRNNLKKREPHFVFVGNIPPTTTEAILNDKFISCGPIEDICIRCTAGATVLIGQPYRTSKDRQYATVMFSRQKSISKALKLNGSEIHGVKIIVCLSAAQLPEVKEITRGRIDAIKERKGVSRKPKAAGYRGLMPVPTEPFIHQHETKAQGDAKTSGACEPAKRQAQPLSRNFMFWGMTFAKTVM